MILGLGCMGMAHLAAAAGAWAILRRIRTGEPGPDLVLFLLLRLLLVSAAVLAAGLAGALNAGALGIAGAAALGALLLAGERRHLPRLRPAGGLLTWLFVILALRHALQAWFISPYVADALNYHLPKVAEWVRAGAITAQVGLDDRATFPAGFELIELWWVVFLRHDLLIEAAGAEFVALGAAAAYALGRRIGLSGRAAGFAALLFALTPGVQVQSFACLNDGPAAALVAATFALAAAGLPLPCLLLAAGLGIGVKPTYGFALPGAALLFLLARRAAPAPVPRIRLVAALATASLAVGAYWYGRNAVLYGNPIHPMTARGFVQEDGQVIQQTGPRLDSFGANLRRLIDSRAADRLQPYTPTFTFTTGWGPVAFACGLPALLVGLRRDRELRRLAAGFGVGLAGVLLCVSSDPWFGRFILFMPALLAVAVARWAADFELVRPVAAAAAVFQFVATLGPIDPPANEAAFLARQPWRERSAAPAMLSGLPPRGEPVAALQGGGRFGYLLYGPDFSRKVVYVRSASCDEIVTRMKAEGARMIYGPASRLRACVDHGHLRQGRGPFYELAP